MSTILWGTFQSVVCLGSPQSTRPHWSVTGNVHVPLENQIIISFKSSRLIIIPRNIISYHITISLKIIISLRIWRNWPIDSLYMPISSTHVEPIRPMVSQIVKNPMLFLESLEPQKNHLATRKQPLERARNVHWKCLKEHENNFKQHQTTIPYTPYYSSLVLCGSWCFYHPSSEGPMPDRNRSPGVA